MPKIVPPEELDHIAEVVSRFPEGAGVDDISRAMGGELSLRTLQRRLAVLSEAGRVVGTRMQKAFRYRVAPPPRPWNIAEDRDRYAAENDDRLYISREGLEIRAYVRRPLHERLPVGYRLAFLEAYVPNVTEYMPAKLREQLQTLGGFPAGKAPAGTFARDVLARLLIDLSWASSRLEGNSYSHLDTERLIRFGEAAEGKDALETQMILNHKEAIEYLVRAPETLAVDAKSVIELHALLSDSLLPDPMACGRLRRCWVGIGASVYQPLAVPQSIEEIFHHVIDMAAEIQHPIEQSFFLMVHLPYLQPFEDVNKRVSRLAANIPLIQHNLCPLSFLDLPERDYVDAMLGVYELNRIELLRDVYVRAYARSCQQYAAVTRTMVPPDAFRLRHRAALAEAVRTIVHGGLPATAESVFSCMPPAVAPEHHTAFANLVVKEFVSLHAGNAVRFGLRPLELEAWAERLRESTH